MWSNEETICFHPIGYVESEIDETLSPDKIKAVDAHIVIEPDLADGLHGLEAGQKLMVVFYFNRSQGFKLFQHPRGDRSRPVRGVFALHSPRRPNPIGVTIVNLAAIDGNVLRVQNLDAINGTPVLDIKLV
ncbi:MAG: tRNA (N6-threonylcarbamoyladenosine(37)-N6)-methyltransferase TrmO [Chloroflexota bacterium]|nr:tRNA (N6-threonylcarbamoyladenosine(37)-N6)-methyltransferase TrmO [Chloroflexota bacterium]